MRIAWRAAAALGVSGIAAGALLSSQHAPGGGLGRPFGWAGGAGAGKQAVAMCDGGSPAAAAGMGGHHAVVISGRRVADEIRAEVRAETDRLKRDHGVTPGLAVVLVGNRTDSATYVRAKKAMAESIGFHSIDCKFDEDVSEREVLDCVTALNEDPQVHAILVQLPLPAHMDEHKVLSAVLVEKDVDGFSALNVGNLALRGGKPPLAVPCTPAGCIELLQRSGIDIRGKEAVVLGRSNIVGMPVAHLLQSMDATVTVCHSRTADIESHVRRADILIAAIGKSEFVRGEWLKPGCVVIDVGINSKPDPTAKRGFRLVGDVHFESAEKVAGMITPVPGGVGPMTIVMLMKNTVNLCRNSIGLERLPLRLPPSGGK
ncbi:tetrahydrofolate dehydrogenase [Pavlovales sp. CCMP2436]|nr:tetrahydrofolate dehydrogenase [Pavlovales sp. CCMP2436]